jgi:hypothetical protein
MEIQLIEQAIENANNHISQLDDGPLSVGGFTSIKIRHLLNNLGFLATAYFEVGSHIGSTYISTCYKNELGLVGGAFACDSFCEFNNNGRTKDQFIENCERYLGRHQLWEKNCWDIQKIHDIPTVDLYLYDGGHDYESQKKAVTHFAPMMYEEFVMLVDDASWDSVKIGTDDGIKDAGLEVLYDNLLWNGKESDSNEWWNGFRVLLLKRN